MLILSPFLGGQFCIHFGKFGLPKRAHPPPKPEPKRNPIGLGSVTCLLLVMLAFWWLLGLFWVAFWLPVGPENLYLEAFCAIILGSPGHHQYVNSIRRPGGMRGAIESAGHRRQRREHLSGPSAVARRARPLSEAHKSLLSGSLHPLFYSPPGLRAFRRAEPRAASSAS